MNAALPDLMNAVLYDPKPYPTSLHCYRKVASFCAYEQGHRKGLALVPCSLSGLRKPRFWVWS